MKITTKGVTAHDRAIDLEKLNLFVGPNGAGKSTINNALRFLALGYVPALGKRPVDTAALMSNGSMEVELTMDDGRTIRRSQVRTSTGYQQSAEASWLKNTKPSETGKEIVGLFGAEEIDVAEALDVRQLINATPNQRTARIEQLLDSGKRPASETAAAVARLTLMRLVPNLDEKNVPENYMDLLPLITKGQRAVLVENAEMLESKIGEAGIGGAMTWANEQKRFSADGLKRKEAAAEELRRRSVEVAEPDQRDIATLESERDELQQAFGAAQEKERQYNAKAANRKQWEEALEKAIEANTKAKRALGDLDKQGKEIAELRKKSETVVERMASLKHPQKPDETTANKAQAEIDALHKRHDSIELPEVPDESDQAREVKRLEQEIDRAKSSPWAEVLSISLELKKSKDHKARAARLEKLAREGLDADPDAIEHELDGARAALKAAHAKAEKVRLERDTRARERLEIKKEIDEKAIAFKKARSASSEKYIQELAKYDEAKRSILNERQNLEHKIAAFDGLLEKLRKDATEAQRREDSLRNQLKGLGEVSDVPPSVSALSDKLAKTKAELAKLIGASAVHAEIQHAIAAIEEAKAARDVFAAIEWALQRQREVEISEAGGPLKKFMARFFESAGRKEQPFIDAGAGSCIIGWLTPDDKKVQVQAMSGGEWALFTAALTSAIILCRKAELRFLLVEAGETDAATLAQLLRGVKGISKGLTAAIVLTPHAPQDGADGWSMLNLVNEPAAV